MSTETTDGAPVLDGQVDVDVSDVPRDERATAPEDDNPAASAGAHVDPDDQNGWGADEAPDTTTEAQAEAAE